MNFLITGAQFRNKGAQSLLFTTINAIKTQYKDATIYYVPIDGNDANYYKDINNFNFYFVYDDMGERDLPLKAWIFSLVKRKSRSNKIIKHALQYNNNNFHVLSRIWDIIDVHIDVSGYILSSKFSKKANNRYLRYIDKSSEMKIPVFLMPQSFGPFDYSDKQHMMKRISSSLKNTRVIFAREKQGQELLEKEFQLNNVLLQPDIVLQEGDINLDYIFSKKPDLIIPRLSTNNNNVGIIPNQQTLKFGEKNEIIDLYRNIIKQLNSMGKNVYILRHSNDLEICQEIFNSVHKDYPCTLITDDIDCLTYSMFVQQFDFIIASRYHSIIHAYKKGVPSIILGWSEKYQSLAEIMNQRKYVFDITSSIDQTRIISSILDLNTDLSSNKMTIESSIKSLHNNTAFQICWNHLAEEMQ